MIEELGSCTIRLERRREFALGFVNAREHLTVQSFSGVKVKLDKYLKG
jgi:hypothetical protein